MVRMLQDTPKKINYSALIESEYSNTWYSIFINRKQCFKRGFSNGWALNK